MAIEFTCPSCASRHAVAERMAGLPFRCSGCGKMLTAPASAGAAATEPDRSEAHGEFDDHHEDKAESGGMGMGVQVTLLVIGGLVILMLLFFCLGGVGVMLPWFMREAPPPVVAPPPVPVK